MIHTDTLEMLKIRFSFSFFAIWPLVRRINFSLTDVTERERKDEKHLSSRGKKRHRSSERNEEETSRPLESLGRKSGKGVFGKVRPSPFEEGPEAGSTPRRGPLKLRSDSQALDSPQA